MRKVKLFVAAMMTASILFTGCSSDKKDTVTTEEVLQGSTQEVEKENTQEEKYQNLTPFLNIIPPTKKNEPKFVQPPMRFKPKNDYEKVYDALVHNFFSFKNEYGRKLINKVRRKAQKKEKEKKNNSSDEDEENKNDDNLSKNSENSIDSEFKKYFITKNLRTKKLHSDLHDKTYFRAVENFPLFGSTMLNKKTLQTE